MLSIVVINLSFKEYKVNDKLDWILNRSVESFLAPEIYEGVAPNVVGDLYSIGCLLYFATFFEVKLAKEDEEKDFYGIMESFKIDQARIDEQEKILSNRFN
jgi:calcium-dependent protein kinase